MELKGIKSWNEDDRPREKLLSKGIDALSNSEILAILINNGTANATALDLAKELLQKTNNNLNKLSRLTVKEILELKIKGLGPAKAITIIAALELGNRRDNTENRKLKLNSSKLIASFLKNELQHKSYEVFIAIYLDSALNVLHHQIISEGGITGTVADPRIILKIALQYNATKIILSHNHPSGNLKPSEPDKAITTKIALAASYHDIEVLDHIIISDEGYFSFADDGLL